MTELHTFGIATMLTAVEGANTAVKSRAERMAGKP